MNSFDEEYLNQLAGEDSDMLEDIKKEIEYSIINQTPEYFEGLGPEAWTQNVTDEIQKACYHGLTSRLGTLVYRNLIDYLYDYHRRVIDGDLIAYSKQTKGEN